MANADQVTMRQLMTLKVDELKACLRQLNMPMGGRKAELQSRLESIIKEGQNQPNYQPDLARRTRAQHASMWRGALQWVLQDAPLMHRPNHSKRVRQTRGEQVCGVVLLRKMQHMLSRPREYGVETITPGAGAVSASQYGVSSLSHNTRIRCICGRHYAMPEMIQCGTPGCGLWQHCSCVGVGRPLPKHYICVACRMARADPFWEPVADVGFAPTKLSVNAAYNQACGPVWQQRV